MTPVDLLAAALEAQDDELEIPLPTADDEPEIPLTPDHVPEPAALAPVALMQVLPADFPLPTLIRFVPDVRLKAAADDAARYALSLEVRGAEGLTTADEALTVLRGSQKAIVEHFAEPKDIANRLHRSISGTESEWLAGGEAATDAVGRKVYVETKRLKALADEERRKLQQAADEQARADATKRAKAAEQAQAPAAVVENLKAQAQVARAAPVSAPTSAPPKLAGTTVTKNWTCTIAGTPRDAEQQPAMADLDNPQRARVLELMRAVLEGKAPILCFELGWQYLKKRAKADEATFNVPYMEAYDAGGTRAKGTRSK